MPRSRGSVSATGPTVATANVPYTTRMIVRRPADPAHFFGTIQIEPLRDGDEAAAIWDMAWPAMVANGEVWVGFTVSKSDAASMQEKFDRSRYASLKIADDGQRWDIMTQVAAVLQSPDGPLGKLKFIEQANKFQGLLRVYSSGWSLTGCMQAEFINKGHHAAARLPNGDPLISGYLAGGCPQIAIDAAPKDVAVMEAVSESAYLSPQDAEKTFASRRPDGNKIGENRYRWYELAGTGDIEYRDLPALSIAAYQMGAGTVGACAKPANILPGKSDFVRAMLADLDDWIRFGIRGPVGKVFELDDDHKIKRDANGNALGGLRPYWVEVPTTRFVAAVADGPDRNPATATCVQIGHEESLPAQELAALYKDHADYAAKITKYLDQSIKDRVLLLVDGEAERDHAVGVHGAPDQAGGQIALGQRRHQPAQLRDQADAVR